MTTRYLNKKAWSQLLTLLLSFGIASTALSTEITEPVNDAEQISANTNSTPTTDPSATDPVDPSAATAEEEDNVLSSRLDPKHQQYMRGQLAYWFEMYETAFKLWMPLAEEGEPKSQTNIGWLYHQGLSVEKDLKQAAQWYQKAADQDYVIAQHNIGTMYEHGWGVEQDFAAAAKWYQFGVDKAYGPSLFNLGMLYLNGLGVKADKNIAIHHLRNAHALKVSEATNKLKELGVKISEEADTHSQQPQPRPMRHSFTRDIEEP